VTTPAKEKHTPEADDGDCTTAVKCTVCGTVTTPAKEAHTPGEDDGDCTTAVKCTVCGTVTTPAKEKHTPETDDGDCTTAIKCTVCDKNAVEAKTHSDGEDDNHACDNSGCTVDNVDGGHHGGTATCKEKAVCAECGQSYGGLGDHTGELQWIQTPATHKQIYVCCGTVVVNETSHDWGEDNFCTTCHYGCTHTYENPVFVWQADFSAAKVTVTCGNCEDVKELNCEINSQWDADTLTFTATAGEYTDTQTIQLAVVGGKLTITNSAAEADEAIDMIIMIAGYTSGGKMTGCQVIEDVSGVTEQNLTFSSDTVKVFFLKPGTYAPLFAWAEL
ncbi:MAG: hypothetical protein J6D61_07500, partial [Clostridia bacterium]|nr:hypothetical protein [Clostridia bacterium]